MSRTTLALVATVAALNVLDGTSASTSAGTYVGYVGPSAGWLGDCDIYPSGPRHCRSWVVPCSLDGVNPVYHPSIFGNPRVAWREYGFIRARDGSWHVEPNCVRGLYHGG